MTIKALHSAYFPELYGVLGIASPKDTEHQTYGQFCGSMKQRKGFVILDNGHIVGCVSFSDPVEGVDCVIHAIILPKYQKRWITKGLCKIILHYPFSVLKATRISAPVCVNLHPAAARLLLKLGFKREGILRKRMLIDDELHDVHMFGMLHEDLRW